MIQWGGCCPGPSQQVYLLTGGMKAAALTLEILCLLLKFSLIFRLTVTRLAEAMSLQPSSPVFTGNPFVPGPELDIWKEDLVRPRVGM